jgi:hypothetical protein
MTHAEWPSRAPGTRPDTLCRIHRLVPATNRQTSVSIIANTIEKAVLIKKLKVKVNAEMPDNPNSGRLSTL